jgi:hypothetical protein
MENHMSGIECQVCRKHFKVAEVIRGKLIEKPITKVIQESL